MPGVSYWWYLLAIPLSFFVSMAWKAVRMEVLTGYWAAVLRMTAQVVLGMIGMFVGLAVVIRVIVPMIPGD